MSASARHVLRAAGSGRLFRARNTLIRGGRKETLSTRESGRLTWYACGPTVYDDAHLGHARTYVSFDIARRVLSALTRVDIVFALGVTDVDDKIIARAAEHSVSPQELARKFEARFFADLAALNVLPPTRVLRVTEHIPELVAFIANLVEAGAAYTAPGGDVYFSVHSAGERYAQLDPSRALEDAVVPDPDGSKRDARDFALWKGASDRDTDPSNARWPSPWGPGRPGWHVECATMASSALNGPLDIHSGGIDLRFPHHTNELALAEAGGCCTVADTDDMSSVASSSSGEVAARWAHTWLHAGHVHISGRKMSKSVKNFVTVREFLADGGSADAFRMFCLLHRYATPVEFAPERITHADALLARVRRFVRFARSDVATALAGGKAGDLVSSARMHPRCPPAEMLEHAVREARASIEEALVDDFDTPRALAVIAELITTSNRVSPHEFAGDVSGAVLLAKAGAGDVIARTMSILGISGMHEGAETQTITADGKSVTDVVDAMVQMRAEIRRAAADKDLTRIFAICDTSRERLRSEFSVMVQDKKDGSSTWEPAGEEMTSRSRRQEAARRLGVQSFIENEA